MMLENLDKSSDLNVWKFAKKNEYLFLSFIYSTFKSTTLAI